MAKPKYKFNPETISYDEIRQKKRHIFLKIVMGFVSSLFLAFVYYVIWSVLVDSPKEKLLKNEIKQLSLQYDIIQEEMTDMETTLDRLQETDDKLYRSIFESEPVAATYRMAGKGGIKRYKELEGYTNSQIAIQTAQRLDDIRNRIYVQTKSYDELLDMADERGSMLESIPAIMPLSNENLKRTASGFGMRMHPIYKIMKFHNGMDFTAPTGTDVYATGKGVVSNVVKSQKGLGNYVTIDHGFGYTTTYAHLDKANVKKGQKINRGDVIGFVGSSGLSVAPHLHYEVKYNNNYVDPSNFYFNDLTADEYAKLIEIASSTGQSFD